MYVSEIRAEGFFVTFPWWLKNVKSMSKIALFSNERHFEIWFPKKRTITFFWSKLSKLHKKHPILHVATTVSLKQGETRTSHGPIPHPLTMLTGYSTPGPYFWRLCAFSQNIKKNFGQSILRIWSKMFQGSWKSQFYSNKMCGMNIFHVLSYKTITTWVSEIPVQ